MNEQVLGPHGPIQPTKQVKPARRLTKGAALIKARALLGHTAHCRLWLGEHQIGEFLPMVGFVPIAASNSWESSLTGVSQYLDKQTALAAKGAK